ncbi:MAG TPA: hypothetical protein DET40_09405 [Lentisphaeria bacterium]|nr:MAG: hypothetical protein A2X45_08195 [Lentisphaerae bacterium GWF2_50_93]HCE43752.1 hypothetical protein [Lentisphaeria bacterium]
MAKKDVVMTFKVDGPLLEALNSVPNRSEFIRSAILSALNNICPLCGGTGIFTPDQRKHWDSFNKSHAIEQCHDCHATHIVCKGDRKTNNHPKSQRTGSVSGK